MTPLNDHSLVAYLAWMQAKGTGLLLRCGADGIWECSWSACGTEYVGRSGDLVEAVGDCLESAGMLREAGRRITSPS